jgi:hypothetical protein
MSTNKLTPAQTAAHKLALELYTIERMQANGGAKAKPVIVIPQFELDTNGEWVPVQSNGVRSTKKDGFGFIRLGMPVAMIDAQGKRRIKVLLTNSFDDTSELIKSLAFDGVGIGDAIPECVLVIEESLTPFNKKDPSRDQKFAGVSGIPCMLDDQPIYRRVKLAPVGTENVLIAHNNNEQISKFQSAAWAKLNKASNGLDDAAAKAAKIAELTAIPKAKRTAAQKEELAELMD